VNNPDRGSLLKILRIPCPRSDPTDNTLILSTLFSSGILIVFVNTNSLILDALILSIAGPESTPCVAHT
jgi:hypothetical protein